MPSFYMVKTNMTDFNIKKIVIIGLLFMVINSVLRYVLNLVYPAMPLTYDLQSFVVALLGIMQTGNIFGFIILAISVVIIGAVVAYTPELEKEVPI